MRQSITHTGLTVLLTALLAWGIMAPATAQEEPTPEQIERVREAIPDSPRVEPAQPRRVLVFSLTRGFYHGAIPLGAKMFEMMGEKTGAFETVVSNDIAMFEPESISQFDAIIINNTTGELFTPPDFDELDEVAQQEAREREARLKESFLDFVRGGGGIVGVHAATDTFYEWPEYGELIGGYFHGHPWNAHDTVHIKIDDPAHPLTAAFEGETFAITEEIYQFRDPYSRENLRVLMSLDTELTDMTLDGIHRTDDDFAISWVRSYGDGRVFYCSLGHNLHIFWTPSIVQHYLDGVQFAVGDLEADTTPSAQLSERYLRRARAQRQAARMDGLFDALAQFEFGDDGTPLQAIERRVVESYGNDRVRRDLEHRFITLLEKEDIPYDAVLFACRQLYIIGTEATVPVLTKLLHNEQTAHPAQYALERLPESAAVDRALREALVNTTGRARIGIVLSIAERGDERVVAALAPLLNYADTDTAKAAAIALGKIGGSDAIQTLKEAQKGDRSEVQKPVEEGILSAAAGLITDGESSQAKALYESLYASGKHSSTRAAALSGLTKIDGLDSAPRIVEALQGHDFIVQTAAAEAVRTLESSPRLSQTLLSDIESLDENPQTLLIYAMADRAEQPALRRLRALMRRSDSEMVRVAVLDAISVLGSARDVPVLTRTAVEGSDAEIQAARSALNRLRGSEIDDAIVEQLESASHAEQKALLRSLGERHATGHTPAVLAKTASNEAEVRIAAFHALSTIANAEQAPQIIERLVVESDATARQEAENALVAISRRHEQHDATVSALLAAYPESGEHPAGRNSIVQVLGELGDDAALDVVRDAIEDPDETVQETAIRALANWPTPTAISDLYALARDAPTRPLRIVALRAYLRLLEATSDRDLEETVDLYEQGLDLAERSEDKRLALSGLAEVPHVRALDILQQYADDSELGSHARTLIREMEEGAAMSATASHNSGEVDNALDGDRNTRWSTNAEQQPGQWFQIDLGWERNIQRLILDAAGSDQDYPRGYEVYVTNDPEHLGEAVASGEGDTALLEINLDGTQGRFIRILQTGSVNGLWWSIHDLDVEFD